MSQNRVPRLWYVAYGTNLSWRRFRHYLVGGRPEGSTREYPGCRDHADPTGDAAVALPGGVYFTGHSSVWGGGMAVYDAGAAGNVAGRAYLLTEEQFADVVAQETRRPAEARPDFAALHSTGRHSLGPARYQTIIQVGRRGGVPMVTFTAADHRPRSLSAPTERYLRVMATGLRESRNWSVRRIGSYLASLAGVEGNWTAEEIAALAAGGSFHSRGDPASP